MFNYLSNNIELDDLVTEFKIHPNPSSQQVYIDYPSSINFNALYITDLTGRIVAVYPPDAINLNIEENVLECSFSSTGTHKIAI